MAYTKGTDAAGGGSNVNQAWVNKVAEEKWAAEQEAKKRREAEEDRDRWAAKQNANDANAQKQEQLAARQRAQEQAAQQAAAQKAAQEKAQQEAAIQAARQRAQEQQEAAARAEQERQRQAEERAQREAAVREAEALRQEQLAARKAEQERIAREKAAAQAAAELAAAQAAAAKREEDRKSDASGLSYTGSGASPKTQEREAEWFAPKTETPAAAVPAATATTTAEATAVPEEQWMETPESVAEVKVSQPRYRTVAKRTEEPVVYTGESSTGAGNKTVRRMAAGTKAALLGEGEDVPGSAAWILKQGTSGTGYPSGTPTAVIQEMNQPGNEYLKEAYERNIQAWKESGYTQAEAEANAMRNLAGQLGYQMNTSSGNGIVYGGAAQPAANGTPVTQPQIRYNPRPDTSLDSELRYPVTKMTAERETAATPERTITISGQPVPESTYLEGQEKIDNEQLAYERGLANYLRNNGAQVDSNGTVPIAEWFKGGKAEQSVYNDAYQAAYDQVIAAGGSYQQADTVGQNAGNMAVRQYSAEHPKTESQVSEGTTLYDEITAAGNSRRSGENRAEANAPQGTGQSSSQGSNQRNGSVKMTTAGGVSGGNTSGDTSLQYTGATTGSQNGSKSGSGNGSIKMTTSGGVSGGQQGSTTKARNTDNKPAEGRTGAANALDSLMNAGSSIEGNKAAEDYLAAWQRRQADIEARNNAGTGTTTSGSQSGSGDKGGTGAGTTTTTARRSGEERAEKKAPKGSVYFDPSYKQGGKGVKLPYDKDGYSENDLKGVGNNAYGTDRYGHNAYEGYYYWNGKYYPVDQEKAAYYKANGNSYKGWEEPMREYYQTFGTYYGYRPDWKTAGGKNVWKANNNVAQNYRPAKSSSTPGGSFGSTSSNSNNLSYSGASGRSYGRGSTVNNGLYWNGNTSWSI